MTWLWPDLDLTSGPILKLTFRSRKIHVSNRVDEPNTMVPFLLSLIVSHIKKVFNEKTISVRNDNFSFDGLWSQNCRPKVKSDQKTLLEHEESCPMFFFSSLLSHFWAYLIAIVCEKVVIFSKFNLWWPQYWPDLKMTCVKVWDLVAIYLMTFAACR